MTLILHLLTSLPLKRTLILAKSLTSDPYNRGPLKRRKNVTCYLLGRIVLPINSPDSHLDIESRCLPGCVLLHSVLLSDFLVRRLCIIAHASSIRIPTYI